MGVASCKAFGRSISASLPKPQTPSPWEGAILLGLPPLDPVGGYAPATPFSENTKVYQQSERQSCGSAFRYMFYFLLFLPFLQLLQLLQPLHAEQSPEQPPFLIICIITSTRAITISTSRIMLGIFISSIISPYAMPKIIPTQRTRSAIIHAIAHCINTVTAAERTLPSSRFTVAIAATHGV